MKEVGSDDFTFKKSEVYDMQQQLRAMQVAQSYTRRRTPAEKKRNAEASDRLTILANHMVGNRNFVVPIDGKSVGLLSASIPPQGSKNFPDNGVFIHGIVSLPGTSDVGKEGIKQAIQMSRNAGHGGRVNLEFKPGTNSLQVYEHFGFRRNGDADGPRPNLMTLSPSDADKFMAKYRNSTPHFNSSGQ